MRDPQEIRSAVNRRVAGFWVRSAPVRSRTPQGRFPPARLLHPGGRCGQRSRWKCCSFEPAIAEHGYAVGARDLFGSRKHPANAGRRAQHREYPGGSKSGLDPERMVSAGLFQGHSTESFYGGKNVALALPFQIVLAGHLHSIAESAPAVRGTAPK